MPKTIVSVFIRPAFIMLVLTLALRSTAQTDTVKLRIIVTDAFSKRGLQGASVVDRTSGVIAGTTDINGYAEARVKKTNQFYVVATGYHALPISIADSADKTVFFLRVTIEPFTAGLNSPVIILGNKSLDKIAEERNNLGRTPSELQKPKMSYSDAIGMLYEKLSARAREREKLKKEIVSDDRWTVMTELLNYCNEKQLITLPSDRYNEFINYCDMSVGYLKSHSDYEIISAISAKYTAYIKLKPLAPAPAVPQTNTGGDLPGR